MLYEVIGKDFRAIDYDDTETYYENQMTEFSKLFPTNTTVIYHYFNSAFRDDFYTISDTGGIYDAIDSLAIKEGVNLVKYENGNYGFSAFYGDYENGFEIIPTTKKRLLAIDKAFSDMEIAMYNADDEIIAEMLKLTDDEIDKYLED